MAILDPHGEQFGPWSGFRFGTGELEHWFDGQKRILVRNVDFPSDAPFDQLKRRLELAAHKRRGRARVWQIDEDHVGILLMPPWLEG